MIKNTYVLMFGDLTKEMSHNWSKKTKLLRKYKAGHSANI